MESGASQTPRKASPLQRPRILIAGGGTGGHIIPALAVARELVASQQAEILFVGTARGLETRLVPQAGFPLHLIEVGQLNNVSLATKLRTVAALPLSLLACRKLIRSFKPGAVLGVGGYASGPAMAAAILSGIPTVAFEPNAVPGMTNRLVGKRVSAAAVNFATAAPWFRNAEVTGIPVRSEFFSLPEPDSNELRLLIFGGSQGARLFNRHLPTEMATLLTAIPNLKILHQSGPRFLDETVAAYRATSADPGRYQVEAFLDDMPTRFAAAHLVLARSGASTVAELAAAGKPSLLIPFAAAADNHQLRNAEAMVAADAAILATEPDLPRPGFIASHLQELLTSPERLQTLGRNARTLAHPDAATRIANRLLSLIR